MVKSSTCPIHRLNSTPAKPCIKCLEELKAITEATNAVAKAMQYTKSIIDSDTNDHDEHTKALITLHESLVAKCGWVECADCKVYFVIGQIYMIRYGYGVPYLCTVCRRNHPEHEPVMLDETKKETIDA